MVETHKTNLIEALKQKPAKTSADLYEVLPNNGKEAYLDKCHEYLTLKLGEIVSGGKMVKEDDARMQARDYVVSAIKDLDKTPTTAQPVDVAAVKKQQYIDCLNMSESNSQKILANLLNKMSVKDFNTVISSKIPSVKVYTVGDIASIADIFSEKAAYLNGKPELINNLLETFAMANAGAIIPVETVKTLMSGIPGEKLVNYLHDPEKLSAELQVTGNFINGFPLGDVKQMMRIVGGDIEAVKEVFLHSLAQKQTDPDFSLKVWTQEKYDQYSRLNLAQRSTSPIVTITGTDPLFGSALSEKSLMDTVVGNPDTMITWLAKAVHAHGEKIRPKFYEHLDPVKDRYWVGVLDTLLLTPQDKLEAIANGDLAQIKAKTDIYTTARKYTGATIKALKNLRGLSMDNHLLEDTNHWLGQLRLNDPKELNRVFDYALSGNDSGERLVDQYRITQIMKENPEVSRVDLEQAYPITRQVKDGQLVIGKDNTPYVCENRADTYLKERKHIHAISKFAREKTKRDRQTIDTMYAIVDWLSSEYSEDMAGKIWQEDLKISKNAAASAAYITGATPETLGKPLADTYFKKHPEALADPMIQSLRGLSNMDSTGPK